MNVASAVEKVSNSVQVALSDARVAGSVGVGTAGISLAQVLGWFESHVGLIGAVLGMALTLVTIKVQMISARKLELEMELMKRRRKEW
jgi:uncharacterized membrane protein YkgB